MIRTATTLLLLIGGNLVCHSQTIINAYARVTNISSTTLTLANVDESADTYEDGDYAVIMQMQDNVIGISADNATFGSIATIGNAGLYEIVQILSHTESVGTPNTITLTKATTNNYFTGGNRRVQLISFPTLGSPDYTTTFDMIAKAWDGNTGGILALNCDGVLTLANNLSANQQGFRGAGPNAGGSAGCDGAANFRVVSQDNMADKGESIYRITNTGYAAGRGRIINGGGGGNSHNGGGAGGGNYSAGGDGGPGWPTCSPSAGGLGGLALSTYISPTRIFMGGGGGAGEGNNNLATDGGDGGGIILIKALELQTVGACGGINVSANGESIAFAGNDGGGGAGAGGSIVFEVSSWSISAGCNITISASGGDGGGVNNGATHGGGGGGGQGVVIYSITEPTANTTTITASGSGGCNNNSNPCNSQAGSGGGNTNDGVIQNSSGPLPVELLSFNAKVYNNDYVHLRWSTASEINNSHFVIERSVDGNHWDQISQIQGAINSSHVLYYEDIDLKPVKGISFYRLKQVDRDGTYEFSDIRMVNVQKESEISIYPNPSTGIFNLTIENTDLNNLRIYNSIGQEVTRSIQINGSGTHFQIDMSGLANGLYTIQFGHTHLQLFKY